MTRGMHLRTACASLAICASGCLPADSRPEPAEVFVEIRPSVATKEGFATADGWTIRFERFVSAVGDVELEAPEGRADTACNEYSEANSEWLYDFTKLERGKVGLVHGLGECDVTWRSRSPSDDTVVGVGATEQDRLQMIARDEDDYAVDQRVSVWAIGTATQGDVTKTFGWVFRRNYELASCSGLDGEGIISEVTLRGGERIEVLLELRAEELFRAAPRDDAELVFSPFAQADADGDGAITLVELADVPVDVEVEPMEDEDPPETLADLVYAYSLPRLTRIAGGGPCKAELRARRQAPTTQ